MEGCELRWGLFQPRHAEPDFRPTNGILYLHRIRREFPVKLPPRPDRSKSKHAPPDGTRRQRRLGQPA